MVIRYRKHLHLPCQFGFLCGSIQGYPAAKSLRYDRDACRRGTAIHSTTLL